MIFGVHALIYAREAERVRDFFRDVLEWPFVDAGHGWLIFAMPPSEVGIHPAMPDAPQDHQIYLMTHDVHKAVKKLEKLGLQPAPVRDAGFGLLTSFELPGGGPIGMYQPRHPIAAGKKKRAVKARGAGKAAAKASSKSPKRKRGASAPVKAARKPARKKKR